MSTSTTNAKARSECRQRQHILRCRVNSEEKALIEEYAQNRGITVSSLLRLAALGCPCEAKGKRLPTHEQKLLSQLIGQLGKVGSNINQIARSANTYGQVETQVLHQHLKHLSISLNHVMGLLG